EYLKWWALNFIEGIDRAGYVSGCATKKGPRPIFGKFAMKPFLAQGVWLASLKLNDFTWIEPHYAAMLKVLEYRDRTQFDPKYGLYFWDIAMQSGADNNPALNYFTDDKRSFLACDASTWQLRELIAQANIAEKLGKSGDATKLRARAVALKAAINKILWCEKDQMFYNVDRQTGDFYQQGKSNDTALPDKSGTYESGIWITVTFENGSRLQQQECDHPLFKLAGTSLADCQLSLFHCFKKLRI
ncbi:MAG: hypothetical protein NTV01_19210, partial [Bacteroidia bacterium]|nr:hypothetical protein [Bacteroidia bacterium]